MFNDYYDRSNDEFFGFLPKAEDQTIAREFFAIPILLICLATLVGSLSMININGYAYYQAQAARNRIARIYLPPQRGEILDRNGLPLAINHLIYDCYFVTSGELEVDLADLEELCGFLSLSEEETNEILTKRSDFDLTRSMASELWAAGRGSFGARSLIVKRDLNQVEVTALLERSAEYPRAFVEQAYRRSYPAGESAAQLVGYTAQISQNELDEMARLGYVIGDIVGKGALEKQYDNYLRGEGGQKLVAVDARGRILGEAGSVPAVVPEDGVVVVYKDQVAVLVENEVKRFSGGVTVSFSNGFVRGDDFSGSEIFTDSGEAGVFGDWTIFRRPGEAAMMDGHVIFRQSHIPPTSGQTLHTTIDSAIQREVDSILGDTVGGVLMMNPRDGAIIAMVSEPGYDPNLFGPGGVDAEGWQAIMDDENHPLLNRPVQNAYVPGSTFKISTAIAALENGVATTGSTYMCRGYLEVGGRRFRCWNRGGHGSIGFYNSIAESCDVAFWEMGQALGHDEVGHWATLMGFGDRTGIDLPNEHSGLIPDEEWKLDRIDERWYTGDTMNMSIGQGFVQTTLVQQAVMTSSIANGGYVVSPHINRLLTPRAGTLPTITASDSSIASVAHGMRQCVTSGTGRSNQIAWLDVAGKTGTAEDPPREEPHSWFVSYAPYDNPVAVLVVMAENGGHGDELAAPMSSRIWQCDSVKNYLEEMGVDVPRPEIVEPD